MKKLRLSIIHYLPLEYYPPATNFLNLAGKYEAEIRVYSTHNVLGRKLYQNENVTIQRFPLAKASEINLVRAWRYAYFQLGVFIQLVRFRPHRILYYETFSALPAYLYLPLFRKTKLYIHFHEYFDPGWYEKGMRLVQLFHRFEVYYLFRKANWISQTNLFRLELFHRDYPFLRKNQLKVMPNYPPRSWSMPPRTCSEEVRMVYIGSLSFEKTYIREVVDWITTLKGGVRLDVYSYNLKADVKSFLQKAPSQITFFEEGIEYDQIPSILNKYDVGLILYKGVTVNYRFNATNKLFEYQAGGIDVWFPEELEGIYPYISENSYPKVLKLDFARLDQVDVSKALDRSGLSHQPKNYFAEDAFAELCRAITGADRKESDR